MYDILSLCPWLLVICFGVFAFYVYRKHLRKFFTSDSSSSDACRCELPPLKRQDMTVEQLKRFDGRTGGHICVAVRGKIYDVSSKRALYGQGGPYDLFAGRDASRCLAKFTFDEKLLKDHYDDLSDISASEIKALSEWATQFAGLYPYVGRLLGDNDEPDVYSDEEEEGSQSSGRHS